MSSGPSAATGGTVRPEWFVVDATDKVLGRLATRIASILAGKHRPDYLPYQDAGDFVVVTNASKVRLTGRKMDQKEYRRHTGYPGGLRSVPAREMSAKYPERIIEAAVRGMLPKSRLGRKQFKKLKVYRGAAHPHEAQKPRALAMPARRAARTN